MSPNTRRISVITGRLLLCLSVYVYISKVFCSKFHTGVVSLFTVRKPQRKTWRVSHKLCYFWNSCTVLILTWPFLAVLLILGLCTSPSVSLIPSSPSLFFWGPPWILIGVSKLPKTVVSWLCFFCLRNAHNFCLEFHLAMEFKKTCGFHDTSVNTCMLYMSVWYTWLYWL